MSRIARMGARARRMLEAVRTNPYIERYEEVRRRNEDQYQLEPAKPEDDEADDMDTDDTDSAPAQGASDGVPHGLKVAGGWSWRLIVIAAAVIGILYLANMLAIVVVPFVVSMLLAAMLQPLVTLLVRIHVPRTLAVGVVLVGGIMVVSSVLTYVVGQFISGVPQLAENVTTGVLKIQNWAKTGPLHLTDETIEGYLNEASDYAISWVGTDAAGAAETAADTLGIVLTSVSGLFLVLFTTFFLMRDGRRIWTFLTRMLPAPAQEPMTRAGDASWSSLVSFVRATILVAIIDAVGIGIGLIIMDVPLAIPLAALVFLGAFIPIIGATVSGTVAVLVALVGGDWITALIVLGIVLAVQQIESHVLQPVLMGRAVSIHPLAVVLAVASGVVLADVFGALIAVPIVAVLNAGIKELNRRTGTSQEPDNVTA